MLNAIMLIKPPLHTQRSRVLAGARSLGREECGTYRFA